VLLNEDDRLAGEWFLIAEAQDYLSGLIAQDLSGFDVPSDERKFRGLWTFDANMVNRLQENLSRLLSIEPLHYDSRNHNYDGQMRQIAHVTSSLIEDLEKRNANLEHWQTLRRDLVSMIVHDLRNPLSVISGYLELIERAIRFGEPAEQILSFVKKAQTGSFELSNLIDDILDLNRLVAGDFPFEPESVAVLPLFEEMFQQYTILAQRRRLSINMELEDPMLTVYADRQTLKRILANLMSNAFRHTETGGVTLEAEACEGAGIQLGVVDTGEGIPAESLPHIFDQFYQVRGKGRKRGTSGLGLAFCKRAVEAQGGEIWVESTLGQGTGFYFCLPAVEENVPAADAVGSET
jgi:signal transduction histidine kinase